jgi:ElaB/YqjD/DUF883 family membrane-anchored ribosome-binding protein
MDDGVTAGGRDRMAANLRRLIAGTEDLMNAVRKDGGDQYRQTIERIEEEVARAREQLDELQDTIAARTRVAVRRTDRLVHEHPWESAGAAAGAAVLLGVAIGIMISRSVSRGGD